MSGKKTVLPFSAIFLLLSSALALMPTQGWSQLAAGKSKFLGNAITTGLFWPNYSAYWNQVTPGNAGKVGKRGRRHGHLQLGVRLTTSTTFRSTIDTHSGFIVSSGGSNNLAGSRLSTQRASGRKWRSGSALRERNTVRHRLSTW